ncbi:hypothetical protein BGZ98_006770 [Dissophora globulifera]|nr:hypothetical protein BGZ98_006770 [Dissophora globulifera]
MTATLASPTTVGANLDSEKRDRDQPSPTYIAPPDGGYGWVVVGACFLNNFSMLGILLSWGIFQQLYTTEVYPGQVSAISWVGTLAFGCQYIVGSLFSLFAARIGYRRMILMGAVLTAGGCVAASFATKVWHLYLSQGVLFGVGAAMANPCVLAAPAQWFVRRRGLASGIAISGSGIGGLAFSFIIQKMNATIGFRWCLRVLAIIVWCSMTITGLLMRQFSTTGKQAVNVSMKDVQTMRQPTFLIMLLGVLMTSFGYFTSLNLMPSPVLAEQFGTESLTILVGVTFGINGVGSLTGTPIATAIFSSLGGGSSSEGSVRDLNAYRGAIGFAGGVIAVGALVFFVLKLKVGGKRKPVAVATA